MDRTQIDPTALPPSAYVNALLGGSSQPYANPQFLSKDQLDYRRRMAQQLMTPMQVHRPMEGVANMFRSAIGGNEMHAADMGAQGAQSAYLGALGKVAAAARGDAGQPPASSAAGDGGGQPMSYAPSDNDGSSNAPSDTAQSAKAFYEDKGLSPVAAAGLAGGFANEGGPTSVAKGDGADGSDSIGIGQWNGPRAQALRQFAADNKMDPNALRTQLEFSWQELNGPEKGTLAALQTAKTPQDAAVAAAGYERPAGWTPQNPTGASHFDRRLASTNALLGGGNANAAGAIDAAAPQGGSGASTPNGAMAFSGAQPQDDMLATNPPGYVPPGAAAQSKNAALARALIHGPQPSGPSPQDLALVLGSPFGTAEGRALASKMIVPEMLRDPYNGVSTYRVGDDKARNVLRGTHFGTVSTPDATVETSTDGGGNGPPDATRLVVPPGRSGGANGNGSGPLSGSGVGPIVDDAQHMRARGAAYSGDAEGDVRVVNSAKANGYAAQQSLVGLQQANDAAQKAGYGVIPNLQAIAGAYGINTSGLSELQAFQKVAGAVAATDPVLGPHLAAALPNMGDTKESRQMVMDRLLTIAQRQAEMGRVAFDNNMPMHERAAKLGDYPLPEQKSQVAPPQSAAAPGGNIVAVTTPDQARALSPGTKFKTPDGRVMVR